MTTVTIYLSFFQNITKEKAGENGISTARLPIDEYMEKIPQESYSKVLSVNQGMFSICTILNLLPGRMKATE